MKQDKSPIVLQILNIAGFICMVAVNALANILRFNGKNTGELSDKYPNLFVPAGITFAIWGVIYLLLLIYTIYQARDLFKREKSTQSVQNKIGLFFFLSCAVNSLWIVAWHYEMVLVSLLIIIILLSVLITIYIRLGIGFKEAPWSEKLCIHMPFSIYLGWISIAVIANATAFLVKIGLNSYSLFEVFWTIAAIMAGTILTLFMIYRRNDIFYGFVVLWAFTGIIIKRSADLTGDSHTVIVAAAFCIAVIALGILTRFRKWLKN